MGKLCGHIQALPPADVAVDLLSGVDCATTTDVQIA
jgi:hypothetical protein